MRLVYLIHSLHGSGGMERVLSVKASCLAERYGHDVHIVTASLKGRRPFFSLSPEVTVHDLATGDSFGPRLRRYAAALGSLMTRLHPDVTISMGGNDIYVLKDLENCGKKVTEFHFSHDKFSVKYSGYPFGRIYAGMRIRRFEDAARHMDRLVVLTKADLGEWRKVIPSAVQIYNPFTAGTPSVSSLERKRFVAAGRLASQKNYESMLRAWAIVARRHPDWNLDIYGEGPRRKRLLRLIDGLGLGGCVHLMGIHRNMAECMADSSGIVMSSVHEGFPLVLVEAASCGLPLVSYDCPRGPSELIRNGVNGFLAAVNDEPALADGICRIIGDRELRLSMGRASLDFAGNFAPERIMARWQDLFSSLVDNQTDFRP